MGLIIRHHLGRGRVKKPKYKTMYMTQWQLDSLPEYSTSTPTGVYIGKIWKMNINCENRNGYRVPINPPKWLICTFEEEPDQVKYPGYCKNGYYVPIIVDESSIVVGENRGGAKVFIRHGEEYKGDYEPVRWER